MAVGQKTGESKKNFFKPLVKKKFLCAGFCFFMQTLLTTKKIVVANKLPYHSKQVHGRDRALVTTLILRQKNSKTLNDFF